ncbi:MAG TPA: porin family protein [Sulfurovum sp.]|nr:porin family protein [Sulfurovum sp.]
MNKIKLSLLSAMALSTVSFAGGDIAPVSEPEIIIPAGNNSVSGFYAGIGASVASTREESQNFFDVEDGQDRTGDITLVAGYDINEYIAIEGRYQFSVAEENILDKTSWGIFAKPQYSVTEDFKVYGLLGYGGLDVSGTNHIGSTIAADDTGFQWGLGASYEVYENISIFIDYLNIASGMSTTAFVTSNVDIDSDAFTIGVIYHF